MTPSLIATIAPLGRRVLDRERRHARAGGAVLARAVAERRRPKHLEGSRRLAVGRTVALRATAGGVAPAGPPVEMPSYLSEFAAQVLFGTGPAPGIPFEQALPELDERLAVHDDSPGPPPTPAATAPSSVGPAPRGRVHEGPQLKLSRRPAPPATDVEPLPAPESAVVADAEGPAVADVAEEAPPTEPLEPVAPLQELHEPSAPEPTVARAPVPIAVRRVDAEQPARPVVHARAAPPAVARVAASAPPDVQTPARASSLRRLLRRAADVMSVRTAEVPPNVVPAHAAAPDDVAAEVEPATTVIDVPAPVEAALPADDAPAPLAVARVAVPDDAVDVEPASTELDAEAPADDTPAPLAVARVAAPDDAVDVEPASTELDAEAPADDTPAPLAVARVAAPDDTVDITPATAELDAEEPRDAAPIPLAVARVAAPDDAVAPSVSEAVRVASDVSEASVPSAGGAAAARVSRIQAPSVLRRVRSLARSTATRESTPGSERDLHEAAQIVDGSEARGVTVVPAPPLPARPRVQLTAMRRIERVPAAGHDTPIPFGGATGFGLAEAFGGDDGTAIAFDGPVTTVTFGASTPSSVPALARAAADDSAHDAPAPAPAHHPTAPPAPPAPSGAAGHDLDEIYDHVVQRLRRDLLADHERMGGALNDLP